MEKKNKKSNIQIIPLGGCGEFGMNMTAYIAEGKVFLIDAGIMFPQDKHLGVSSVVPAVDEFLSQFGKVTAYIITHGHEDHIGALAFMARKWPAPVYATRWTVNLIMRKYDRLGLDTKDIHMVAAGDHTHKKPFVFEWIHVNHSIPDACALYIKGCGINIFHTGDFKFDFTPIGCPPIDIERIKQIGRSGLDYLFADSTNSMSEGLGPSETAVINPLKRLIASHSGRVIITTFASNLWRLAAVLEVCKELNKKLVLSGRAIFDCYNLGIKLGYIKNYSNIVFEDAKAKNLKASDCVLLVTGSQGEERSALSRIVNASHRHCSLRTDDLVIFSARIIPGNEKEVFKVVDNIKYKGAKVITTRDHPLIHVSGHAYRGELDLLRTILRPKHYIPIHGSMTHLMANSQINQDTRSSVLIRDSIVVDISTHGYKTKQGLQIGHEYIDYDSNVILTASELQQRLQIGELGLVMVSGLWSTKNKKWHKDPMIELIGLKLQPNDEQKAWTNNISKLIAKGLSGKKHLVFDHERCSYVESLLRKTLYDYFKKKVVIKVIVWGI